MLSTRNHPYLLAALIAGVIAMVALFLTVLREPIPERHGTAPSVVQGTAGTDTPAVPAARGDPRDGPAAVEGGARAARGSGIEGVPSSGVTLDPPNGR